MTVPSTPSITLTCHPLSRAGAVHAVEASLRWQATGRLAVRFVLHGDADRLRIPDPQPSRRSDQLWTHTCFEMFVKREGAQTYHELNFAPAGEWAVYAFHSYRRPAALPNDAVAPEVTVRRSADRIELDAVVRLGSLSTEYSRTPLRVALAAVIEDAQGRLSYWALRHPLGKPDFHHPDAFAVALAAAAVGAPGVDSIDDPR